LTKWHESAIILPMEDLIINNGKLCNGLLKCVESGEYYEFVMENENKQVMGHICFSLKEHERYAWLIHINTEDEFQHLGIATILACVMEYVAVKSGYRRVEGVYCPLNQYARAFYLKNGYTLPKQGCGWDEYDQYWRLGKNLDYANVERRFNENVLANVVSNKGREI